MNAPTKRQRLAEWIQKQDPYIYCLQETHLKTGDTYGLKVKGWKKIFHANRDQKKAGIVKHKRQVPSPMLLALCVTYQAINDYLKSKWVECPNQKAKTG